MIQRSEHLPGTMRVAGLLNMTWLHLVVLIACVATHQAQAAETVSVQVTDGTATEGTVGDSGILTIRRATATASPLTVHLTRSGTATSGVDFGAIPASVVIPANATSVPVHIHAIDDVIAETSETVIVTIAANAAYAVGSPNSGTVDLRDDEATEISLSATDNSASEPGSNTGTFTITRKGRAEEALYVPVTYAGTAIPDQDYQAATAVAYLAPFSSTRTITVSPKDDTLAETDETVVATIHPNAPYLIVGSASATVTILDNEAPVLSVVASDATAAETGGNTGAFRIERSGNKSASLTVSYGISGSATGGADYTALSGTVAMAANQSSVLVTVTPIDDSTKEGPETIQMTLATGTGYTIRSPSTATVTLAENEQAVSIAAGDRAGHEPGTDKGHFIVTRSSTSIASSLAVPYTVGGTATGGADYAALSGTATIPANATSVTIPVDPIDDTVVEGLETVVVTLSPAAAYAIVGPASVTVEIGDNETTLSTVTVSGTANVAESTTTSSSFTVVRTTPTTAALTVWYQIGGTATAGSDYPAFSGSVVINAGATSATIPFIPTNDTLSETSETVVLTLAGSGAYVVGAAASATKTITDDDEVLVALTANDATASEPGRSDGNAQFTVTRTGLMTSALTIPLQFTGSALAGVDYATPPAVVSIPANTASATVTITPLNDVLVESTETVTLTIAPGTGYTLVGATSATANINDDEAAVVSIVAGDPTATEGGDTAAFQVTRSGRIDAAITIPLVRTGTAGSGTDFTALPTTVSLAANAASATVTVTTINDASQEGPESIVLTLGTGTGYTVGSPASATVTIIDDEPAVSVRVIDLYAREGGTPGAIAIQRTGSLAGTLTVSLGITGSAVAGTHYQALPTSVTFAAGVSSIVVPVVAINDSTWRAETMVQIGINAGSYAIVQPSSGTVLITDNDNLAPTIAVQMQTPDQSSTTMTLDASGTTDPNGDPLTYRWSIYGAGVLSTTAQLTYDFKLLANQVIELLVSDGKHPVYRYIPVLYINTATTIPAGDVSDDGGVLIVDAATATINGAHQYLVGRVINGGVITHAACTSTILSSLSLNFEKQVFVDAASRVDVSARGLPKGWAVTPMGISATGAAADRSGASYGGYGVNYVTMATNEVYGSFDNPNEVGSGGGGAAGFPGSAGGGLIRLTAGALTLNGSMLANGEVGSGHCGGSGGGIYVSVGTYGGTGTIQANGSNSQYNPGGGGRVALYYTNGTVDVSKLSATGGYFNRASPNASYGMGGAGTVYIKQSSQASGTLIFDNKHGATLLSQYLTAPASPWYFGSRLTTTDDPATFPVVMKVLGQASAAVDPTPTSVTWKAGSALDLGIVTTRSIVGDSCALTNHAVIRSFPTTASTMEKLELSIAGTLSLDATSRIDVSGLGCPKGYTWSAGGITNVGAAGDRSGGSYGGYGAKYVSFPTNEVYGGFENPNEVGSGGGSVSYPGDSGGGLIRLTAGTLTLNGSLLANGQVTTSHAGGSGGGIYVNVGTYGGTGTIQANGSNSMYNPGGGGRVALYYGSGTVDLSKLSALGGYYNRAAPAGGYGTAGAGTVYVKKTSDTGGTLIIDNQNVATVPVIDVATPIWFGDRATLADDPAAWPGKVEIKNKAEVACEQWSASSMTLTSGAWLHSPRTTTVMKKLVLAISGTLSIDATSRIDVSALGCPKGYTWSAGGITTSGAAQDRSGGSYGGYGVNYVSFATNEVYGSFENPNEVGSGGGGAAGFTGDSGGGLIRLTAGTLTLNGSLLANGQTITGHCGGSGGGIYVNVGTYGGTGTIQANGSDSMYNPGGGGRVALYYTSGTVDVSKLSAAGGYFNRATPNASYGMGGAGTVYLKQSSQANGTLIFDNKHGAALLSQYLTAPASPWYFGSRLTTADDPATFSVVMKVQGQASVAVDPTPTSVTWKAGSALDRGIVTTRSIVGDSCALTNHAVIRSFPTTASTMEKVELSIAGTLSIDATSRIDVSSLGCPKGYTWSAGGITNVGAAGDRSGGSYGGYGTKYVSFPTNEVYGGFENPNEVGSGGGSVSYPGDSGGGLIRLTAGTLTLNGSLLANGQVTTSHAGGSGGGIYVNVGTYGGTGTIQAGGSNSMYNPGGGGRVALYYGSGSVDVSKLSALGGYYNRAAPAGGYGTAGAGTVYVKKVTDVFGRLIIDNGGIPHDAIPTPLFHLSLNALPNSLSKHPEDFQLTVQNGGVYITPGDPLTFDADSDGLKSWEEFLLGTNPRNRDTNANGISDGIEVRLGDPLILDSDGDGVSNAVEQQRGTDPFRSDSDGDGVADGVDVFPTDPSASSWPTPPATDTTPPVITISSPAGVVKL